MCAGPDFFCRVYWSTGPTQNGEGSMRTSLVSRYLALPRSGSRSCLVCHGPTVHLEATV